MRAEYAAIARAAGEGCGGPRAAGCCADGSLDMIGEAHREVAGHVAEADLGLGCGVPTRHAALRPGATVLDLGRGAGNHCFVARHEVGETGRVLGVDMTPETIAEARANAEKLGFANVEFRLGEIEHLPVESGRIDRVISNRASNLVPDKARAFAEIARVSKPGGRLRVSDIVATGPLPEAVREAAGLYVGRIAGALPRDACLARVAAAGLDEVRIVEARPIPLPDAALEPHLDPAAIAAFRKSGVELRSVTLLARPAGPAGDRRPLTFRQGTPSKLVGSEHRRALPWPCRSPRAPHHLCRRSPTRRSAGASGRRPTRPFGRSSRAWPMRSRARS